jgi:hypothetical protein
VTSEGEVLVKFALQFKKLEDAVAAVIDFLGKRHTQHTHSTVERTIHIHLIQQSTQSLYLSSTSVPAIRSDLQYGLIIISTYTDSSSFYLVHYPLSNCRAISCIISIISLFVSLSLFFIYPLNLCSSLPSYPFLLLPSLYPSLLSLPPLPVPQA